MTERTSRAGFPFTRVPAQLDEGALALYPGVAPGSEGATQTEIWTRADTGNGTERWARNVTAPTLLPVLPAASCATGAAVLVVPGGGFQFVSMDNEGYPVAAQLAEHGIAAFVLKYRTMATPPDEAAFAGRMATLFDPKALRDEKPDLEAGIPFARADAQAALRMIRARAGEWNVDPARLGMLGFSAGAMTLLATLRANETDAVPAFAGYLYGPMIEPDLPDTAPPVFVALAADDMLFGSQGFGLVDAWRRTGAGVELHVYEGGGHGFGAKTLGKTSDRWFDQFVAWMGTRGLLERSASGG